jgi:hypothetical protein
LHDPSRARRATLKPRVDALVGLATRRRPLQGLAGVFVQAIADVQSAACHYAAVCKPDAQVAPAAAVARTDLHGCRLAAAVSLHLDESRAMKAVAAGKGDFDRDDAALRGVDETDLVDDTGECR